MLVIDVFIFINICCSRLNIDESLRSGLEKISDFGGDISTIARLVLQRRRLSHSRESTAKRSETKLEPVLKVNVD